MRLELRFELEKNEFKVAYRSIFLSYLKHSLTKCRDGKYYDHFFQDTNMKDYSFSAVFTRPRFLQDKMLLEDNQVKFLFSCDDRNKTGLIFFNAFIEQKHKKFCLPDGNSMVLKEIIQKREKLITSSKVIFKVVTGSGLCIREHNRETNQDRYFTFADEAFQKQIKVVLEAQCAHAGFQKYLVESIRIEPLAWKKVVIKHYGAMIDCSIGQFVMEADPELLQYFYQAGLGSRNAAGFGMLDLVAQE